MSNDYNTFAAPKNTFPDQPFDLAHIPDTLSIDDSPAQNAALQAVIFAPDSDTDEETRFHAKVPITKSLSYFQKIYDQNETHLALDLITKRMKVDYRSDRYLTPTDSNAIAWDINSHYLDMMVCVGNGLGLGAIMPNQAINSLYQVDLDFGHRTRNFHTKHAKLGFNPKNAMLWVGQTPSREDIWIAWIPKLRIDDNEQDDDSKNTILSERHYRATVLFFADMLSKIPYRDIIVRDQYPDLSNEDEFKAASNIM